MLRNSSARDHEDFWVTSDKLRDPDSGFDNLPANGTNWWPVVMVSGLLSSFRVMRGFGLLISILTIAGFSLAQAAESAYQRQWKWGQQFSCYACSIKIVTPRTHPQMETPQAQAFFRALENEKPTIMALYGIDGQQYNLLAHMAVGILGQESQFFQAERYHIKEAWPLGVRMLKRLRILKERVIDNKERAMTANSRGPTQIKSVPELIHSYYGFDESELGVPRNAAVATMGFLIRALREMKTRMARGELPFVTKENLVDYLPYLYFGHKKMLLAGKAEPHRNIYVRNMKAYMAITMIYEQDSEPAPGDVVMQAPAASRSRVAQ